MSRRPSHGTATASVLSPHPKSGAADLKGKGWARPSSRVAGTAAGRRCARKRFLLAGVMVRQLFCVYLYRTGPKWKKRVKGQQICMFKTNYHEAHCMYVCCRSVSISCYPREKDTLTLSFLFLYFPVYLSTNPRKPRFCVAEKPIQMLINFFTHAVLLINSTTHTVPAHPSNGTRKNC